MRRTKQKNTDWEQAEQKREAVKPPDERGSAVGAAALLLLRPGPRRGPVHRVLLWLAVLALIAHTVQFGGTAAAAAGGGESINEARKY